MDKFFCLSLIFIPKEIHSAERYSIFVATEIVDMKTIYINLLFFFPGRMLQSVALWQNHTRWCCYNDSHHGLGSVHYVKRILLAIDRLVTKMSLGPKNAHFLVHSEPMKMNDLYWNAFLYYGLYINTNKSCTKWIMLSLRNIAHISAIYYSHFILYSLQISQFDFGDIGWIQFN